MDPEGLRKQGIQHEVHIPESGGEKEDAKNIAKEGDTKPTDPPKDDPPPKRSPRSPRGGIIRPPRITKENFPHPH